MTKPIEPNGRCADLPDRVVSMCVSEHKCPYNPEHTTVQGDRRVSCTQCKVWWWIERLEP